MRRGRGDQGACGTVGASSRDGDAAEGLTSSEETDVESRPTISPRNPSGTTSARPRPARDSLEPAWFPELLEIRGRLFRFARSGSFRLGGLTVGLHLGGPFLAQGVDEDTAGIVVEGDSLAELRSMVGEALELLDEDDLDSERDQLPAPWLGGRWA